MVKYRIRVNGEPIIVVKEEKSGLYKDVLSLSRYNPKEFKDTEQINDCADCNRLRTPKGKQCGTISRMIKEKIRAKGLPLDPKILIPLLDKLGEECKRYVPKT